MAKLQYVLKIRDHTDANLLCQIANPENLKIEIKLNDFSKASFFLSYGNPYATTLNLRRFNRIDIYEQIDNFEYRIFEGVIRGYNANLEGVSVECEDFLYLLSRRILSSSNLTMTADTVENELQALFDTYINGVSPTGLDVNHTDIITSGIHKEYSRGENMAKIIKDMAVYSNAEFIIRNRLLEFKETIGVDRTVVASPEYRDFRFDVNNPNENSILSATIDEDSINFANVILGKSDASYSLKTDATSIAGYGRIEAIENFPDSGASGLADQTQAFLDLQKTSPNYPKIKPSTKNLYFKDIGVGDLVPIYINTGSDLFFFDGSFKIVKTTLRGVSNAMPLIDLEFSENALSDKNFLDEYEKLKSEVKTLILKS